VTRLLKLVLDDRPCDLNGDFHSGRMFQAATAIALSIFAVDASCDPSGIYGVNWHDLLNTGTVDSSAILKDTIVDFDQATGLLTLGATLEYVGLSTDGNFNHDFVLGTTYWIDLQPYGGVKGAIESVGSCANRRAADYEGLEFAQYWTYTPDPTALGTALVVDRMAYPPSEWTLSALDCNTVKYERTFSWKELSACTNAEGNPLVTVETTEDAVRLKGTFFVELVSPFDMNLNGFYRTFPLVKRDFVINISLHV